MLSREVTCDSGVSATTAATDPPKTSAISARGLFPIFIFNRGFANIVCLGYLVVISGYGLEGQKSPASAPPPAAARRNAAYH